MILRVFWPNGCPPNDLRDQPCLLLGALLHSTQKSQAVTSAVVIAPVPLELLPPLPEVQQQLAHTQVTLPCSTAQARLAVLGVWLPQHQLSCQATAAGLHGAGAPVWLVLRGQQALRQTLGGCSWRAQQVSAPVLELQQCVLPPDTESVQLLVYAVPAQQPGFAHVQLPLPLPAPQLPWMTREPGAVSLSTVMHMLQEAHAALQDTEPQQQLQSGQADQAKDLQPQPRTRQQLRRAQQQQEQHAGGSCSNSSSSNVTGRGWSKLAAVWWAAECRRPKSWLTQQWASLAARVHGSVQRMAAFAPSWHAASGAAAAAADRGDPHASTATATPGGVEAPAVAAGATSTGQPYLLQLVVQQLLGLLIALNLLLHQHTCLDAAAAAGSWLQEGVLQPHIAWLMQAHPGGVKLHLELSLLLGTAAEACLQAAAALYRLSWPLLGPTALTVQAVAAAVGGASWGCAAAADVLLVLLWPLVLLYVVAAHLQQLQLTCLAATWRLIRGKQKVRRFSTHHRPTQQQQAAVSSSGAASPAHSSHAPSAGPAIPTPTATAAAASASAAVADGREPGDEVSVEQLIVGVLLFTPLLGLLPTTTAWYLSICALYAALHGLRLLLVGVGSWLQLRPLHVLAASARQPLLFPGQLMLLPCRSTPGGAALGSSCSTCAAGMAQPGTHITTSSSRRRAASVGPSTATPLLSQAGGAGAGQAGSSLAVSTYHIFYEPCSYWEVLVQSIAQQQGLLWYACQGVGSGSPDRGDPLSAFGGWVRDVAVGRVWGLRLLSTR